MRIYNIPLPTCVTLFHGPILISKLGIMTCCVFEQWICKTQNAYLYTMQLAHFFIMKRFKRIFEFRGSLKILFSFLFGIELSIHLDKYVHDYTAAKGLIPTTEPLLKKQRLDHAETNDKTVYHSLQPPTI